MLSRVQLFATPWTVAHQAPLSMGFSRQEYWSGLPCPSPANLSGPAIEPGSPALQTNSLPTEPPGDLGAKTKVVSPLFFQRLSSQLALSGSQLLHIVIKQDPGVV